MWPLIWSAVVAVVLFFPRLLSEIPHRILMYLDALHRAAVRRWHARWQYGTVPHVRARLRDELSAAERARWRLDCHEGRQRWFYDANRTARDCDNFVERYNMQNTAAAAAAGGGGENQFAEPVQQRASAEEALTDGAAFLCRLQDARTGHWPNDYSGPLFLTCGPVFAKYIMYRGDIDRTWTEPERRELSRYLVNIQNEDGGFGMHTEGESTMFGTVLNYVVLRLLNGSNADSSNTPHVRAAVAGAREWIRKHGGAQFIPSWGKVWLCTLGLYEWRGVNAIPAEMWLLPDWLPVSMGRVWCHSRIVTLAFAWLYSTQFRCADTPLLAEIRAELYQAVPYDKVDWAASRSNVKDGDNYFPVSPLYRAANAALLFYEHTVGPVRSLRDRALRKCYEHMRFDDESTSYICLGPVNKALNMLVAWIVEESAVSNNQQQQLRAAAAAAAASSADAPHFVSERVNKHLERIPDYFWMAHDGMRMSGYNGSQLWDTSFAVQAILAAPREAGLSTRFAGSLAAGHGYIDVAQVREDPEGYQRFYRSRAKGAWNFSTRAQGWQVSDCTAEGLRVDLLCREHPDLAGRIAPLEPQRLYDAVDTILSLRNADGDGAWASYEEPRAPVYLELLNCAEVYKDVMVDYTYAECTSSCVHSLILFRRQFPEYRSAAIARAIGDGVREIQRKQRADGSWYGSWGVCFTYAAWLSCEALKLAELPAGSEAFRRSNAFLLSKQRADGGWAEDFNACVTQEWVENESGSQVVNTAWAVMALMAAGAAATTSDGFAAIERGVKFIMSRQLRSGDWVQERISGVFNGNCAIHYPAYKNNMTVWALSKFVELKREMRGK